VASNFVQAATAALTLGRLNDPRAVNPLLEVFVRSRDPELHEAAIWALGELRDVRAVPTLIQILDNPKSFITLRIGCTEALGKIGGDQAVEALRRAARSDQRALRVSAQTELRNLEGMAQR
jgi:HEAT repeat protein